MLVGDRDKRIRASRFTAADRDAAGSRLGGPIFIPGSWVIRMTDQDRPGSGASRAKSVAANNALRREGTVESHEPQEESSDPLRELHSTGSCNSKWVAPEEARAARREEGSLSLGLIRTSK